MEPLIADALKTFRAGGPKGWSFTQTTEGDGHSRVERYDARQPEFAPWTLLQQDGRAPTEDETRDYREKLSRRSRGGVGPQVTDQLDLATISKLDETADRVTYRCRLKEGESGDATAQHLVATIRIHKPTLTVECLEIESTGPFSPVFGVNIAEMKTTLLYSLPDDERPSLLQKTETRVRGRAFLLKSLDADMTVTFSDYEKVW